MVLIRISWYLSGYHGSISVSRYWFTFKYNCRLFKYTKHSLWDRFQWPRNSWTVIRYRDRSDLSKIGSELDRADKFRKKTSVVVGRWTVDLCVFRSRRLAPLLSSLPLKNKRKLLQTMVLSTILIERRKKKKWKLQAETKNNLNIRLSYTMLFLRIEHANVCMVVLGLLSLFILNILSLYWRRVTKLLKWK